MRKILKETGSINICGVILSVLSLCGIDYFFSLNPTSGQSLCSFIIILLFVPVFLGTKYLLGRLNKRMVLFSAVTGLVFSVFMTAGAMLYKNDHIELSIRGFFGTICLAVFFFIVFGIVISVLSDYTAKDSFSHRPDFAGRIFTGSSGYFLFVSLLIFICWIPVFLAFFPGIFNYDAITQIDEIRKGALSSHHPVLHSLFLYVTIDAAGTGLWSNQTGIMLHSIVQMLVLAFSMGYACKRMAKWKAPYFIQMAAVLFFALFPVNPLLALSTTKDIIFSALFLVLTCMTVDLVTDSKKLRSPLFVTFYILTVVAACLFRNTGIYIVAVAFLILLFFKK